MHVDFQETNQPHWIVSYLECPRYFIEALPELVGFGAILYFESYEGRPEYREYLQKHRVSPESAESVHSCSSLRPAWVEHVILSPELLNDVEAYHSEWYYTPADHVHCYREGKLLFWFHDAFTGGELHISDDIAEDKVARFCQAVAPRFRHQPLPCESVPRWRQGLARQ